MEDTLTSTNKNLDYDYASIGPCKPSLSRRLSSLAESGKTSYYNAQDKDLQRSRFTRSLRAQLTVVGVCSLLAVTCGMSLGHSSVLLPELQANHSSIPTDTDTGAWIASVHTMMMPVGCFVGGIVVDMWGRRLAGILDAVLYAIGWLLIAVAPNHAVIILGRLVDGMCKGISASVLSIMVDEFSEPMMRGPFVTILLTAFAVGTTLIYGFGTVMDWRNASGVAAAIPLMAIAGFFFLPDSPVWLVRKHNMTDAKRTLYWVYGVGKEVEAEREYENMLKHVRNEENFHHQESSFLKRLIAGAIKNGNSLTEPYALKPFLISLIYNLSQIFCGTFLFVAYAVDLISLTERQDGEGLSDHIVSVITGVVRVSGVIVLTFLTYWIGRRPLSISSGLGTSISAMILATFLQIQSHEKIVSPNAESWIIFVLVLLYIATNSCGFYVLPYTMTGEMLPGRFRGFLSGIIFALNDIGTTVSMLIYPRISHALGAQGIFWIFGISSAICTIFIYFFIPETRGRSLIEMEDYFRQKNVLWITRNKRRYEQNEVTTILNNLN